MIASQLFYKSMEQYAHHLLFAFYHFHNEEHLKSPPFFVTYLNKLQESVVMEIIEYSKSLIKPFIVSMQTPVIMVSNLCLI